MLCLYDEWLSLCVVAPCAGGDSSLWYHFSSEPLASSYPVTLCSPCVFCLCRLLIDDLNCLVHKKWCSSAWRWCIMNGGLSMETWSFFKFFSCDVVWKHLAQHRTSSGVQLTPCFSLWAENQTLICSSLNLVCEDKPMISDTEGYGNLRRKIRVWLLVFYKLSC